MTGLTSIANEHFTVGVSSKGAETQFIRDPSGADWLWQGDPAWWSGRAPILFPIVGEVPDGGVGIGDKTVPMVKHGFARHADFQVIDAGVDFVAHQLSADTETRALYPFEFALTITHRLEGPRLITTASVENRDTQDMPFGFGFHPAYVWPLPGGVGDHHVILDNGAEPDLYRINAQGLSGHDPLPSPFDKGRLTLNPQQYEADAMIFPAGAGEGLVMRADNGVGIHVTWSGLPNLALWQKPGAPYLCVEPWHGMAAYADASNALTDRPYTMTLPAGQRAAFSLTFERLT